MKADLQIYVYLQRVEDAIQFLQDWKTPFTPSHIVQTSYYAVNKTGLYYLALKECHKKRPDNQTWNIFKQVFADEYHDLVEETKVTSGVAGFHLENVMEGPLSTSPCPQRPKRTSLQS